MLEKVDLTKTLDKETYRKLMPALEGRLGELQRICREKAIPVTIVFEGWDAAGKGSLINRLMLSLDARGYTVHPTNSPNEEERLRPFLWRFWTKTPAAGRIAIFDRSWYGRVLIERVAGLVKKKIWQNAYAEITAFERQLSDDGGALIKFFLHISKKEQKKRFDVLVGNKATAWKVSSNDWENHQRYGKFMVAIEDMLAKTDTAYSPWTIVESTNFKFAIVKVFQTVIDSLEQRIARSSSKKPATPRIRRKNLPELSILDSVDMTKDVDADEYSKNLKDCQNRLRDLEHQIYVKRIPVMILYEGWDAAGKGGAIRRLVQGLDPRGFEVIPVAAPNDVEKAHHYLWRFWMSVPKAGHIAIFDRTWYGRVLVERVEGFCRSDEWQRAYAEINEMEKQFCDSGTALVKFWLHISADEQLRRFNERQSIKEKQWKITDEDWRNREKWDDYKIAVDDMIRKTSTNNAPWTIVEANSKHFARLKVLTTVIAAIEARL
jgi:polyphosphate:AMP phosphotransferase